MFKSDSDKYIFLKTKEQLETEGWKEFQQEFQDILLEYKIIKGLDEYLFSYITPSLMKEINHRLKNIVHDHIIQFNLPEKKYDFKLVEQNGSIFIFIKPLENSN